MHYANLIDSARDICFAKFSRIPEVYGFKIPPTSIRWYLEARLHKKAILHFRIKDLQYQE